MKHCKGQLRTHTVHPKAPQEHKNTENTHNIMQTHEIICKNVLQPVKTQVRAIPKGATSGRCLFQQTKNMSSKTKTRESRARARANSHSRSQSHSQNQSPSQSQRQSKGQRHSNCKSQSRAKDQLRYRSMRWTPL